MGRTLLRLFHLWRQYAVMDLLWVTRDFKTFAGWYLSDLAQAVASVTAVLLLAERFDGLGRWSQPQVVFLLGYALLVRSLLETFFTYNVLYISRRIGRGQFDHVLVQPQPLWSALLTEGFTPFSGGLQLLPGIGLLAWSLQQVGLPLSPGWLLLLGLNLLASCGVVLGFCFLLGSLAFRAPRAAEEICTPAMEIVDQLKPFPLDGLGPALLAGMLTLVPVGFTAWYPTRALLFPGGPGSPTPAGTFLAALVFLALGAWAFRTGLSHYGRTGSQRYLDRGHRR